MANSQVRQILTDADVKAFDEIPSSRCSKYIEPESLAWLRDQWADDELPFQVLTVDAPPARRRLRGAAPR